MATITLHLIPQVPAEYLREVFSVLSKESVVLPYNTEYMKSFMYTRKRGKI